jgi:hypothetical protein
VIRTEVSLSTACLGDLPAEDVVAKSNIFGRQVTLEGVLVTATVAVAGDLVAIKGLASTLANRGPVE